MVLVFFIPLASAPRGPETIPNTIETIIDDMRLPHEGAPHGVPASYGWSRRPIVQMGNDPKNFRALLPWGQLYEDAEGSKAVNTRVELRDLRAYVLSRRDGKWRLVVATRAPQGAAYAENFVEDAHRRTELRPEADGGVSVTAGGGYNFHFWGDHRVEIDPSDIAGVFTTCQARLVVDDPSRPDDRARALPAQHRRRLLAGFACQVGSLQNQ